MQRTVPSGCAQLRMAVVQMRFSPTVEGNLSQIQEALAEAKRQRAQAVLFPECATTGYGYPFERLNRVKIRSALAHVGEMAADQGLEVLVGSAVFGKRGKLFNALVVFDRRGRLVHCYAKCQLTESDRRHFVPGNHIGLFPVCGVWSTSVICHERRYPELVRIAVMAGAQILFHPNAGMDALAVSKRKRGGRDGITVRAFENAVYYLFANSVGPQGGGKWSAGDSKVVAPDGTVLVLADNQHPGVSAATLDLARATRRYGCDSLEHPRFLSAYWRRIVRETRSRAKRSLAWFDLPAPS